MALAFNVEGPMGLYIGPFGGASPELVGYTDNDDLPDLSVTVHTHVEEATDQGREPGALIHEGVTGVLSLTLVKWDEAVIDEIMAMPGSTANATAFAYLYSGIIGTEAIDNGDMFEVTLTPVITGQLEYTFHRCYIQPGESIRVFGQGNAATRLGLRFGVTRSAANGNSATTTLFTTAATGA